MDVLILLLIGAAALVVALMLKTEGKKLPTRSPARRTKDRIEQAYDHGRAAAEAERAKMDRLRNETVGHITDLFTILARYAALMQDRDVAMLPLDSEGSQTIILSGVNGLGFRGEARVTWHNGSYHSHAIESGGRAVYQMGCTAEEAAETIMRHIGQGTLRFARSSE